MSHNPWSPDCELLVSAGMDGNVIGYRVTSTGDDQNAGANRTVSMERIVHVTGHTQPVTSVNLFVDRGMLLMASGGLDHTILLTDPSQETLPSALRTLNNHTGPIVDLSAANAVTNDESALLASVSEDRTVRFWQPGTGRLLRFTRLSETPTAVVLSKDGRQAVVGDDAGKITVIETATARILRTVPTGMSRVVSIEQDQSRRLVYIGGPRSQIQVLAGLGTTP